jgi:hypothetical protein
MVMNFRPDPMHDTVSHDFLTPAGRRGADDLAADQRVLPFNPSETLIRGNEAARSTAPAPPDG